MPKARLRGEKSLALDGANHRGHRERPQEKVAGRRRSVPGQVIQAQPELQRCRIGGQQEGPAAIAVQTRQ